jgi:hydrogenase-1 operon protein HyaF
MFRLGDIPIQVEQAPAAPQNFGNALPILSEIRHAVAKLIAGGEATCIDLAAMPFGPGDEDRLMAILGRGEVQATIDALGPSHIWETRFPGVWVVDYANADGQRIALQIEIDQVPRILRTQSADLADALSALDARLQDATQAGARHPLSADPVSGLGMDADGPSAS